MRLRVTHHAIERMGEYHEEFASCVPKEPYSELDVPQIEGVFTVLRRFVAALERGSTVRPPSIECTKKVRKYGQLGIYIFDSQYRDYYQMTLDRGQLIMATVTTLPKHSRKIMVTEPAPRVRFKDLDAIVLPYALAPAASGPRFGSVPRISGGSLPVSYTGRPIMEAPDPMFGEGA